MLMSDSNELDSFRTRHNKGKGGCQLTTARQRITQVAVDDQCRSNGKNPNGIVKEDAGWANCSVDKVTQRSPHHGVRGLPVMALVVGDRCLTLFRNLHQRDLLRIFSAA